MATASLRAVGPRPPTDRGRSRRHCDGSRRSCTVWPFIAFFVEFFLFWEYSIDWFGIPAYILPKALRDRDQERGRLRPAPLLHLCHRRRNGARLCPAAVIVAVPLGLAIAFRQFSEGPSIRSSSASR